MINASLKYTQKLETQGELLLSNGQTHKICNVYSHSYAYTVLSLKIYRKKSNNGWSSKSFQTDIVQELSLI